MQPRQRTQRRTENYHMQMRDGRPMHECANRRQRGGEGRSGVHAQCGGRERDRVKIRGAEQDRTANEDAPDGEQDELQWEEERELRDQNCVTVLKVEIAVIGAASTSVVHFVDVDFSGCRALEPAERRDAVVQTRKQAGFIGGGTHLTVSRRRVGARDEFQVVCGVVLALSLESSRLHGGQKYRVGVAAQQWGAPRQQQAPHS
ncbi:hypothetical protein K438DRAFT_1838238 [Mycena galopus ATCC 62051]|nr:hypothetical protein K438DRAFT_1838238 [Mycena galopus ATCC 62051]